MCPECLTWPSDLREDHFSLLDGFRSKTKSLKETLFQSLDSHSWTIPTLSPRQTIRRGYNSRLLSLPIQRSRWSWWRFVRTEPDGAPEETGNPSWLTTDYGSWPGETEEKPRQRRPRKTDGRARIVFPEEGTGPKVEEHSPPSGRPKSGFSPEDWGGSLVGWRLVL